MITKFKPMLAEDADLKLLKYPLIVSPKLDGVRATFVDGKLLTRSLKPLANKSLQNIHFTRMLDGELIVGDPRSKSCFHDTMKVVTAFDADPKDVRFHVFDLVAEAIFKDRLKLAHSISNGLGGFFVPVPHTLIEDEKSLLTLEEITVR